MNSWWPSWCPCLDFGLFIPKEIPKSLAVRKGMSRSIPMLQRSPWCLLKNPTLVNSRIVSNCSSCLQLTIPSAGEIQLFSLLRINPTNPHICHRLKNIWLLLHSKRRTDDCSPRRTFAAGLTSHVGSYGSCDCAWQGCLWQETWSNEESGPTVW